MLETWKPIPDYPYHEVSDLGRVRSIDRTFVMGSPWGTPRNVTRKGMVLKTPKTSDGYTAVCIRYKNGKPRNIKVHVLVLRAFIGPCPPGMECCHEDGDRTNNRLENLRWDTDKANMADRTRHGRHAKGTESVRSVLSEDDVREIRQKLAKGDRSMNSIGKDYGVHAATIRDIRDGRTYWMVS